MTPRCFTIEKLVADLGDVCASGDEVRGERTGSDEAVGAALRDRAQTLQEQSLRLRSRLESGGGPGVHPA